MKIEINDWRLQKRTGLKLFFNDKELVKLKNNKITEYTQFFDQGKFFTFILLDKSRGLKILDKVNTDTVELSQETLRKIIRIQKIFYKHGISFDCEEDIFPIEIIDRAEGLKKKFYAYITATDIDFSKISEPINNILEISTKIHEVIWNKARIGRWNSNKESKKRQNYIVTNNGNIKLIDIDPKYFFREPQTVKENIKEEIIRDGQFPYGRRKCQYQSIDEEKMNGIRDMEHRYSILNLPKSFQGKRILDIGCNLGMICKMSMEKGADISVGIDFRKETIQVAQRYFDYKKYKNINLFTFDINRGLDDLISLIGTNKFDYIFALSIWKHVDKSKLYDIINYYCKEKCWFEGHNKQSQSFFEKELLDNLKFSQIKFLGKTTDRGIRPNFLIT